MQAEGVPSPHGHPGNKTEPYTPQDWSLNNIVELLVQERCAPLVEFAARLCQHVDDGHEWVDGTFWRRVAADALAAYRAAQGAGSKT